MKTKLLIGFLCLALVVYFVLLGRMAVAMITDGRPAAVGLGIALLAFPIIGGWAMLATLRAGFAHQKLARLRSETSAEQLPDRSVAPKDR